MELFKRVIFLIIITLHGFDCDRIIPLPSKTDKLIDEKQAIDKNVNDDHVKLIKGFFDFETIVVSSSLGDEFYEKYNKNILNTMSELLENRENFSKSYALNKQINTMIHNRVIKTVGKTTEPFEPADEAILQALDLIVPDADSEPIYAKAKKDLRKFYEEQPELGQALLQHIEYRLDAIDLHTLDAVDFLMSTYINLIPLGRAGVYISKNSSSE